MSIISNFSIPNIQGSDLSDSKKIKAILDALQMLDENMRYSINNLDPEDNFSNSALKIYNGLLSDVKKFGANGRLHSTLIEQNAESIRMEVVRATEKEGELAQKLKLNADGLESKVSMNEIISMINQTAEEITISANRINLNGAVTANNYFKINEDGSVEASAITISGRDSRINVQTNSKDNVISLSYDNDGVIESAYMAPGEFKVEGGSASAWMDTGGFRYLDIDNEIDAIYSGNCVISGYGDFAKGVYIGPGEALYSRYADAPILQDLNNGGVAVNAAGADLILGNQNTVNVWAKNALRLRIGDNLRRTTDVNYSIECKGDMVCGGNVQGSGIYADGNMASTGNMTCGLDLTVKGNVYYTGELIKVE